MSTLYLVLLLALTASATDCTSLKDMLKVHESYRNTYYIDSEGHPTICIGFRLDIKGAKELLDRLSSAGTYARIMNANSPDRSVSDNVCDRLFSTKRAEATKDAIAVFGHHCTCVDNVLIDMTYNLGRAGVSNFKKMKANLAAKNYTGAAGEMQNSKWCTQVKTRCTDDVAHMLKGCP